MCEKRLYATPLVDIALKPRVVTEMCSGYFVSSEPLSASVELHQGHRILSDGPFAVLTRCWLLIAAVSALDLFKDGYLGN